MVKQKVIIYAGTKSNNWSEEADQLQKVLEKENYEVLETIMVSGLEHPKVEYLPKGDGIEIPDPKDIINKPEVDLSNEIKKGGKTNENN